MKLVTTEIPETATTKMLEAIRSVDGFVGICRPKTAYDHQ